MASPYSQIQQVRKPIKSVNTELFGKVVAQKQKTFSKNEALVNQTIAEISKIDLLRDTDKSYLNERLKKVVDMVQNTDNIDFTSGSAGARLGTFITQAVDSNVKKHAAITAKKRAFDKNIQKIKDKNPDQYLEMNHQDALYEAGFYEYMKGNSAEDDIRQLEYKIAVNPEEESLKRLKTLKNIYPDQEIAFIGPDGINYKKKKSALSETEWRQIIINGFTQAEKDQMAIRGRATYRAAVGGDNSKKDEAAIQDYDKRKNNISREYDKKIKELSVQLETATGSSKKSLETAIEQVKSYKTATLTSMDVGSKNAGNIGATIQMNSIANNYAKGLAVDYITDIDYSGLEYSLKIQDRIQKQKKEAAKTISKAFSKATELETKEDKESYEKQFDTFETTTLGKYEASVSKAYKNLESTEFKLPEGVEVYKTNADGSKTIIKNPTRADVLSNLQEDVIKEYAEKNPNKTITESVKQDLIVQKALAEGFLNASDRLAISNSKREMGMISQVREKANYNSVKKAIGSNAGEFWQELVGDYEIGGAEDKIVYFKKDGTQTKMHLVFEELLEEGINTEEKYIDFISGDSEKAKEIRANIALQMGNKMDVKDDRYHVTKVRTLSKEYNEIYSPTAKNFFGDEYERLSGIIQELDTGSRSGENLVQQEVDMRRGLDIDSYKEYYRGELGERSAKIIGLNTIVVPKDDPLFDEIESKSSEIQEWNSKQGLEINKKQDGSIVVTQVKSTEETVVDDEGEKTKVTTKGKSATIQADVVRQSPQLMAFFEGQEAIGETDYLTATETEQKNISFSPPSEYQDEGLEEIFGNDQASINMASKDEAPNQILKSLQSPTPSSTPEYRSAYSFAKDFTEKAMSRSRDFRIKMKMKDNGKVYTEISLYNKAKNNYDVITNVKDNMSGYNFQALLKITDAAPQVVIGNMLKQAVDNYSVNDKDLIEKINKLL